MCNIIINKRNFIYLIGFICFLFCPCFLVEGCRSSLLVDILVCWEFCFFVDEVSFCSVGVGSGCSIFTSKCSWFSAVSFPRDSTSWSHSETVSFADSSWSNKNLVLYTFSFFYFYKYMFCKIFGCKKQSKWSYLCNVLLKNVWVSLYFWVFPKSKVGSHHDSMNLLLWLHVNHFHRLWWIF